MHRCIDQCILEVRMSSVSDVILAIALISSGGVYYLGYYYYGIR